MAKKTNLQALSEAMGKIITAKNYVAWSKIKSFDEQARKELMERITAWEEELYGKDAR